MNAEPESAPSSHPQPPHPAEAPQSSPAADRMRYIFFTGPRRLRAGWRVALFMVVIAAISAVVNVLLWRARPATKGFTPTRMLVFEMISFVVVAAATAIMARLDALPFGSYGLPGRRAFKGLFWQGALWGVVALTVVLGILRLTGHFYFGPVVQTWPDALKYGALWAAVFVMVGLFEETLFRGYLLRVLTDGLTFWPAAIITSLAFVGAHSGNPGESFIGVLATGWVGLLFCLMVRRTGDLWMAVGFHFSWDWAETFFYGVPDSGLVAPGHLRHPSFSGPAWITGGTVGPEGSIVTFAVIGLVFLLIHFRFRQAKYPQPEVEPTTVPVQDVA